MTKSLRTALLSATAALALAAMLGAQARESNQASPPPTPRLAVEGGEAGEASRPVTENVRSVNRERALMLPIVFIDVEEPEAAIACPMFGKGNRSPSSFPSLTLFAMVRLGLSPRSPSRTNME